MFRSTFWRLLVFAVVCGVSALAAPADAPPYATAADAQVYIDMGNASAGSRNFDQAIRDYTRAIQLDPKKWGAHRNRGIAYLELKRIDLAVADMSACIKLNPKNAYAYEIRGTLYQHLGKTALALADQETVLKLDPHFKHLEMSEEYMILEAFKQPEVARLKVGRRRGGFPLQADAQGAMAYVNSGLTFQRRRKYEEAITQYTTALQFDRRCVSASLNRGLSHYALGCDERSRGDSSRTKPVTYHRVFFSGKSAMHTDMYRKPPEYMGEFDQAETDFTYTLRLDPRNVSARLNRGRVEEEMGNYAAAVSDFSWVIKAQPQGVPILFRSRGGLSTPGQNGAGRYGHRDRQKYRAESRSLTISAQNLKFSRLIE